jgi:hypothetical protein
VGDSGVWLMAIEVQIDGSKFECSVALQDSYGLIIIDCIFQSSRERILKVPNTRK